MPQACLAPAGGIGFDPRKIKEPAITSLTAIKPAIGHPQRSQQPRARGALRLSAKARDGASVIDGLRQSGSYRMMFPRSAPPELMGVVVNCAGGMTGGDRFDLHSTAGPDCTMTLTTQAAERIYRATGAETARLTTHLQVAQGARLNWLPQETILFDGSRFVRRLEVDLAMGASFLMIEPLLFGRTAMGEHLRDVSFADTVGIRRAGQLIHADASRLQGDVETQLASRATSAGGRAMASVVLASGDAETMLEPARDMIGPSGAASLKAPDLLCIRLIARDAMALRRAAIPLIALLSGAAIPKTWTL